MNVNEVRNPRYAGATLGTLVRALMRRPMKQDEEQATNREPPEPQESRDKRKK